MKLASAVVGNSSSGIYEAPYLQTPTVDIGSRQQGREGPASIFHCEPTKDSIFHAISEAISFSFNGVEMIYGDGNASALILSKIKEAIGNPRLSIKTFFDVRIDQ
jgi:UDP-N-acetylglucosamine 2-epimerase